METFDELAPDFKLSEHELEVFEKLKTDTNWQTLKKAIERYVLKLTYNLAVGSEREKGMAMEEMLKLRGFVYYFQKINRWINEFEKEKDNKGA